MLAISKDRWDLGKRVGRARDRRLPFDDFDPWLEEHDCESRLLESWGRELRDLTIMKTNCPFGLIQLFKRAELKAQHPECVEEESFSNSKRALLDDRMRSLPAISIHIICHMFASCEGSYT